jgi:hypothetical protein
VNLIKYLKKYYYFTYYLRYYLSYYSTYYFISILLTIHYALKLRTIKTHSTKLTIENPERCMVTSPSVTNSCTLALVRRDDHLGRAGYRSRPMQTFASSEIRCKLSPLNGPSAAAIWDKSESAWPTKWRFLRNCKILHLSSDSPCDTLSSEEPQRHPMIQQQYGTQHTITTTFAKHPSTIPACCCRSSSSVD